MWPYKTVFPSKRKLSGKQKTNPHTASSSCCTLLTQQGDGGSVVSSSATERTVGAKRDTAVLYNRTPTPVLAKQTRGGESYRSVHNKSIKRHDEGENTAKGEKEPSSAAEAANKTEAGKRAEGREPRNYQTRRRSTKS